MEDATINNLLTGAITAMVVGYGLYLLLRRLSRGRPDLRLGLPLLVALVVRVLAGAAISLTGIERFLRGGDELGFLAEAGSIASSPFGSELWTDALTGALYTFTFAAQLATFDSTEFTLRIVQIGIAVAGLVLLAAAVYELAGPRAAVITMWVLALEPASVFFSSILHKEPLMMLASGLVAYGGARVWRHEGLGAIMVIVAGCLVAVATRPYAGWFLIAAGSAIIFHAGLRSGQAGIPRRVSYVALVAVVVAVSAPTVLEATTDENLDAQLQSSQDANASDESNLSLERVDYSTRSAIVTNLPSRVVDVLTQPYIWQVENSAQQLAVFGSLVALTVIALLVVELVRGPGGMIARAGPLLYVAAALLVAYSLSAGNAGTAFRYRTHVVVVASAALVAARYGARERATAPAQPPSASGRLQLPPRGLAGEG